MFHKLFITVVCILFGLQKIIAQMPSWYEKKGVQIVTCRSDDDNEYSMGIIDTRDRTVAPLSLDWMPAMYHHPSWVRSNLGQVFGIALDGNNNIFVTASSSYGMPNAYNSPTLTGKYGSSGSGAIYKIDAVTGVISTFAVIPQDQTVLVVDDTGPNAALADKDGIRVGAGLGNICYDADHNQFFVTSFDDGKIYRISSSGFILNSFDPLSCPGCIPDPSPNDTGDDLISPLGDRPWGIGYYGGKLYFSIWTEDRRTSNPAPLSTTFNQIFSVALDGSGNFNGTESLEVTMPGFRKDDGGNPDLYSNPISDIEFDDSGNMAISERGMLTDVDASGHRSGVFYLVRSGSGTYTSPSDYPVSPPYIRIATAPNNNNGSSSGGVDFTYDGYDAVNMEASGSLSYVWATGHRLRSVDDDAGPGGSGYVLSGTQMSPVAGWSPNGDFWKYSYFVDFDGIPTGTFKTAQGDVDVIRGISLPPNPNCQITITAAGPTTAGCDPATNKYVMQVSVTYSGIASGEGIIINGQTVTADGSGSQIFTLPVTFNADGLPILVTAVAANDPACTDSDGFTFTAPVPCNACSEPPVQVCIGDSYTLNTGGNYANVQWYLDGQPILGATSNTLNIIMNANNMGSYTVVVNGDPCVSGECCPVVFEEGDCCPVPNCYQILVSPGN